MPGGASGSRVPGGSQQPALAGDKVSWHMPHSCLCVCGVGTSSGQPVPWSGASDLPPGSSTRLLHGRGGFLHLPWGSCGHRGAHRCSPIRTCTGLVDRYASAPPQGHAQTAPLCAPTIKQMLAGEKVGGTRVVPSPACAGVRGCAGAELPEPLRVQPLRLLPGSLSLPSSSPVRVEVAGPRSQGGKRAERCIPSHCPGRASVRALQLWGAEPGSGGGARRFRAPALPRGSGLLRERGSCWGLPRLQGLWGPACFREHRVCPAGALGPVSWSRQKEQA